MTKPAKLRIFQSDRDPIFAAIEAHKAACEAVRAESGGDHDIPLQLMDAAMEAERVMFATPPTTAEGTRALGAQVIAYWDFFEGRASGRFKPLFQSFARSRLAGAGLQPDDGTLKLADTIGARVTEARGIMGVVRDHFDGQGDHEDVRMALCGADILLKEALGALSHLEVKLP